MLYVIHAGDTYGSHEIFVAEGPEVDFDALFNQFAATYKYKPAMDMFQCTESFISYLTKHCGFKIPEVKCVYTEN